MLIDKNYKSLVQKVLDEGYTYDDPNRENVKRLEIPSYTFRHNFSDGFPAISTKKLAWKSVVTELIWFLRGDTNIKYLVDNGCNIWNKDAYNYYKKHFNNKHAGFSQNLFTLTEFINHIKQGVNLDNIQGIGITIGDLGKVYGHYWRNFNGVDQIAELISDMINKPMSSELLVVARDPADKEVQALPCCHYGFQIVMRPINNEIGINPQQWNLTTGEIKDLPKYGFELHWKQRSCDLFLGIPFNIASYALLALILEKITGHKALGIQGDLKKVHLYDNSIEATKELITRKCSEERVLLQGYPITKAFDVFNYVKNPEPFSVDRMVELLDEIKEDIELINYNPQEPLKVEMLERDE